MTIQPDELTAASFYGNVSLVTRLLAQGADPLAEESIALLAAATHGRTECAAILIPLSEPKAGHSQALYWAARSGHAQCVKLLMPVSEPAAQKSRALYWAARNGHLDCVNILAIATPPDDVLRSLLAAMEHGHQHCAKTLFSGVDSLADASQVLNLALFLGLPDIAAIALARHPLLYEAVNFHRHRALASLNGQTEMVELLIAAIERNDLEAVSTPASTMAKTPLLRL